MSSESKTLFNEIAALLTEQRNAATEHIDEVSALEIARLINHEDKQIALAVEDCLPDIAKAIELVAGAFKGGGRLFYIGAGTSGRLGILDASECPPTFGIKPTQVQGIIAGGKKAVFRSVEGAEDDTKSGIIALRKSKFSKLDVLCGISASKRTPFVISSLNWASRLGAKTIFLTSNPDVNLPVTVVIRTLVGAEVIMGSTRMKAGTSHKMVLNMITTGAMILSGKTYSNLMIDLQQTNRKLVERTKRIFMMATGETYKNAEKFLKAANGKLKTAILMRLSGLSRPDAEAKLKATDGFIKPALSS
jgi:N-acetylmuramic acid 6-phosphate etherase